MPTKRAAASHFLSLALTLAVAAPAAGATNATAMALFERYCFSCHDEDLKKADLDLSAALADQHFDGKWAFENLITGKMPPKDKKQPSTSDKQAMLAWLASRQPALPKHDYRRISRHEFVTSLNDLLATKVDLAANVPDDRGTYDFDTDRRIRLTSEQLSASFAVADELLETAFPAKGFFQEKVWHTNTLKESHKSYRIYHRPYKDGYLFSWTRANNGRLYSFFYDKFDPPAKGWYELTFDAAKVGDFPEDVAIMVFAGKYFIADDRPQPRRLLDVISLSSREVSSYTVKVFLQPGENVSIHCYSKHTWRQHGGDKGAYVKGLSARGPLVDQWPPTSYQTLFAGLPLAAADRVSTVAANRPLLERLGGRIVETKLTAATPYLILENPVGAALSGLSYRAWAGEESSGYVSGYTIRLSPDGASWRPPIVSGRLRAAIDDSQAIHFPETVTERFIKFEVTDTIGFDGRSPGSLGELDVLSPSTAASSADTISITADGEELNRVLGRFADRAFASTLSEEELAPYLQVSLEHLQVHGDFVAAAKVGMKAIISSHRFHLAPGVYANPSQARAAMLARALWLSVPDSQLATLATADKLTGTTLRTEIERMLADPKSARMVHSFCSQWLNLRGLNKIAPSLKLYPRFNELLDHYLPLETEAFVAQLVKDNLPVTHLIDSDFSFLNQRLAQHYGIDGIVGQKLRRVNLPAESPRGGLLTMASILRVTSDGFQTSPILRGAWISKNVVGTTLAPPPEGVVAIEADHGTGKTLRQQIDEHKNNKNCYACHKSIDPYGFALENFDATGQWRARYAVETPHKNTFVYRRQGYFKLAGTVDASGEIDDTPFKNVAGLKTLLLADHRKIAYNLAKKFFEYANGHKPDLRQRLDLHAMIPDRPEECGIRDLLVDVLTYSVEQ